MEILGKITGIRYELKICESLLQIIWVAFTFSQLMKC
jgi:hypothetical protein